MSAQVFAELAGGVLSSILVVRYLVVPIWSITRGQARLEDKVNAIGEVLADYFADDLPADKSKSYSRRLERAFPKGETP